MLTMLMWLVGSVDSLSLSHSFWKSGCKVPWRPQQKTDAENRTNRPRRTGEDGEKPNYGPV